MPYRFAHCASSKRPYIWPESLGKPCLGMLAIHTANLCCNFIFQSRAHEAAKVPQVDIAVPMHLRGQKAKAGAMPGKLC